MTASLIKKELAKLRVYIKEMEMSDSGDQQAIAKDVAGSLDRLEYWCEELSYRLSGALAEAGEKNRKERANLGRRDFFRTYSTRRRLVTW